MYVLQHSTSALKNNPVSRPLRISPKVVIFWPMFRRSVSHQFLECLGRLHGFTRSLSILVCAVLFAACQTIGGSNNSANLRVRVIVDGKELVFSSPGQMTVAQFLQQTNVQLNPLDRLDPPEFTQITDNMVITIVRVREDQQCNDEAVPYQTRYINDPDLPPGTTKVAQAGANGTQRVCYDVIYKDGIESSRTPGNPTIITQPTDEIIARGVDKQSIEPLAITGTILYISGGEARAISDNTQNDRALPTGGNLDGYVFAISDDGGQLLYSRQGDSGTATPSADTFNELWVLLNTGDSQAKPVRLTALDNILTASWQPGEPYTFSYSTLQPREQVPGYQAFNDLNIARLDSRSGKLLKATPVVKSRPTGVYGLWGTQFTWSPDGKNLAWAQADGVGVVDFKAGAYKKLFDFHVYSTTLSRNWVWTPSLSWSPYSDLLAATVHGQPLGTESGETSPVFDLAVVQADSKTQGMYQVKLVSKAGMWASPAYSPLFNTISGDKQGYIAYLQARDSIDSVSSEYDLVIADRDGSNAKVLFPGPDKPGIKPIETLFGSDIAWSPDGEEVALIYQGDVWIVDIQTGRANQVTIVGNAHHPRWVR